MRAPNFFGDVTAILLSEKFLNKGRAPRILTLGDITRILTPPLLEDSNRSSKTGYYYTKTFRPPKFTTDRTTH